MQAIIDACRDGRLNASPRVVISNNSGSMALKRARRHGIPSFHMSGKTHPTPDQLDHAIRQTLEEHGVNLVVLAGYMKLLGPETLSRFQGRVLNIHPALLPRFGGKGFYGPTVHEAVLDAAECVTGVTIHLADERFDHGPIVAQCRVPIFPSDTADSLRQRVLMREHQFFVETLQRIEQGDLDLDEIASLDQRQDPPSK